MDPRTPSLALALVLASGVMSTTPTQAQSGVAQLTEAGAAERLRAALQTLSRQPNDLGALLTAGEAAFVLDDTAAATGFFTRARDIDRAAPRALAGLARIQLVQNMPIEALRLFAEAERAGYDPGLMGKDRGLAYDLVGDNSSAHAAYRAALAREDDAETRRRLAINLAIAGDVASFEETLLPLLRTDDRAASRTRAFGLSILGRSEEAVQIADAMMPADMALRLAPYLRTMDRLTATQQAAAANLGVFPRAADIGSRGTEIAAADPDQGARIGREADASLTPTGPQLGPAPAPGAADAPAESREVEAAPVAPRPVQARAASEPRRTVRRRSPPTDPLERTWARGGSGQVIVLPGSGQPPSMERQPETPNPQPSAEPAPSTEAPLPRGELPPIASTAGPTSPEPAPSPPAAAPPPVRVADAFADLPPPSAAARPTPGGVDVSQIGSLRTERETEPAHPARHWVQVATGRDRSALAFDWRRIVRSAEGLLDGRGPFVASWNGTNRLLSGPYPDRASAQARVKRLQEVGIDSFRFDSAAGEAVEPLE